MLKGLHGLLFSSDPAATRAFLRDKLALPCVDVGDGWLIFDLPNADLGVHPVSEDRRPPAGTHLLSIWCDDLRGIVADLKAKGVSIDHEITEQTWGIETSLRLPGGIELQLYQPKYDRPKAGSKRPGRSARTPRTRPRAARR